MTLQTQGLQTVAQVRAFVSGVDPISFTLTDRYATYSWMADTLREALNKSTMSRVAVKNVMIARRATLVVLGVRSQGAQRPAGSALEVHSKRAFLTQPARDKALRAVCCVRLLVKRDLPFTSSPFLHPAKPLSRPCGTCSALP